MASKLAYSDNALVDVIGWSKEEFEIALKLAWSICHNGYCRSVAVTEHGLFLSQRAADTITCTGPRGFRVFEELPLWWDEDIAALHIWKWLQDEETWEEVQMEDFDGSASKGWRVTAKGYNTTNPVTGKKDFPPAGFQYFLHVKPVFLEHHK